ESETSGKEESREKGGKARDKARDKSRRQEENSGEDCAKTREPKGTSKPRSFPGRPGASGLSAIRRIVFGFLYRLVQLFGKCRAGGRRVRCVGRTGRCRGRDGSSRLRK